MHATGAAAKVLARYLLDLLACHPVVVGGRRLAGYCEFVAVLRRAFGDGTNLALTAEMPAGRHPVSIGPFSWHDLTCGGTRHSVAKRSEARKNTEVNNVTVAFRRRIGNLPAFRSAPSGMGGMHFRAVTGGLRHYQGLPVATASDLEGRRQKRECESTPL